jgi:hypothetical protein
MLRAGVTECGDGATARHTGRESPKIPKSLLGNRLVTTTAHPPCANVRTRQAVMF